MRRILNVGLFLALLTSSADANWIESWGEGVENTDYVIVQEFGTIEILSGNGLNYKFYAETSQGSGVEGVINNITVAPGATGDFTLLIDHSTAGEVGAAHWKAATLKRDGDSDTWTLMGADVSGNLCADGAGAPGNIVCEKIDGDITAETLVGDITADTMQNLTITGNGPHNGNITLLLPWPTTAFQKSIVIGDPNNPQAVVNGNIYLGWRYYTCDGNITINGDMYGTIHIDQECRGRIHIRGDLGNDIWVGFLGVENPGTHCDRPWIEIDGDVLDPSDPGNPATINRITVGGWTGQESWEGGVHVHGDMGGQIVFSGVMNGTRIYIDGLLKANVDSDVGAEIEVAEIYRREEYFQYYWGAIVINADGFDPYPGPNGNWANGAVVEVDGVSYTEHTPSEHVLNIVQTCVGDVDYDGVINADDWTAYGHVPHEYDWRFPGFAPSRVYHSDGNGDGSWDPYNEGGQWYPYESDDTPYIDAVVTASCCLTEIPDHLCLGDIVLNGEIDISDLAALLAGYGITSGATYDDGDLDGDEDVDIIDLAALLAVYGDICTCPGSDGHAGGDEADSSAVTVSVVAYDTHGYTGGGFVGEVDHFVFDLKIEVNDPNNDDWLVSGAALDVANDATFRLSTSPTTPNQYGTFVGAPWTSVPPSATGSVAGAYNPPDPSSVFTTTELNLAWYDTDTDSDDGPAAVMRVVIDVSEVDGADVSEGFGSVYFSTSGPADEGDIRVARLSWGTATIQTLPNLKSLLGNFYVKGE